MPSSDATGHVSLSYSFNRLAKHRSSKRRSSFHCLVHSIPARERQPILEMIFPHNRQRVTGLIKLLLELLELLRKTHDEISGNLVQVLPLWALRDELEDFPQMLMKPMGVNPRGVHASGDQSPSGLASCAS